MMETMDKYFEYADHARIHIIIPRKLLTSEHVC